MEAGPAEWKANGQGSGRGDTSRSGWRLTPRPTGGPVKTGSLPPLPSPALFSSLYTEHNKDKLLISNSIIISARLLDDTEGDAFSAGPTEFSIENGPPSHNRDRC